MVLTVGRGGVAVQRHYAAHVGNPDEFWSAYFLYSAALRVQQNQAKDGPSVNLISVMKKMGKQADGSVVAPPGWEHFRPDDTI